MEDPGMQAWLQLISSLGVTGILGVITYILWGKLSASEKKRDEERKAAADKLEAAQTKAHDERLALEKEYREKMESLLRELAETVGGMED